jgi:hypothetical protein
MRTVLLVVIFGAAGTYDGWATLQLRVDFMQLACSRYDPNDA